jgi:hypothetical protein
LIGDCGVFMDIPSASYFDLKKSGVAAGLDGA